MDDPPDTKRLELDVADSVAEEVDGLAASAGRKRRRQGDAMGTEEVAANEPVVEAQHGIVVVERARQDREVPAKRTRLDGAASDPALAARNKRLFGALFVGQLSQAKSHLESASEREKLQRQKGVEVEALRRETDRDAERKKAAEAAREARERQQKAHVASAALRAAEEAFQRLEEDCSTTVRLAVAHDASLVDLCERFIRTSASPHIYWAPYKPNGDTKRSGRASMEAVKGEHADARRRLETAQSAALYALATEKETLAREREKAVRDSATVVHHSDARGAQAVCGTEHEESSSAPTQDSPNAPPAPVDEADLPLDYS